MKTSTKLAIFLGLLGAITYASPVRAEVVEAHGRKGTCRSYDHSPGNIPLWDCLFPTANGVSYINLKGLVIRGGSGADIYFCDGNSASTPANGGNCYKKIAHLNHYVENPLGTKIPTDIFIFVHNGNWQTDFELLNKTPDLLYR